MDETISPDEIREIRGMYGLTQRAFAQLLGIGTASMVRYEQGARPSKANANLIRAARHPQFMRECLERDGSLIPKSQREKATRCVYALVSLEPEKAEGTGRRVSKGDDSRMTMTMDEMYHYTIQQEVLNEQAANLIGEMISIKVRGGYRGMASDVFESLLDQVAGLKHSIITYGTMDDCILARYGGYLRCADDLLKRNQLGGRS